MLVHAACLSFDGQGVLILGPPGSGKSDLALRLIDQPGHGTSGRLRQARIVSDDEVLVRRAGDDLLATAPATIAGLLEVRGLGIVPVPVVAEVRLVLVVRLKPAAGIERLPDLPAQGHVLLGLTLPFVDIDPELTSAPARVRAALDWFGRA